VKTNFFGTQEVIRVMMPLLDQSPSPRIVNVASAAGRLSILKSRELAGEFVSDALTEERIGELMGEFVADVEKDVHVQKGWPNTCYGMSKLGIIALTRVLARQHESMMINSVDPGYCRTDQNDNQGSVDPRRGALTPFILSTMSGADKFVSGKHFYEEREISWGLTI